MQYYEVAILDLNQGHLTYHSVTKCSIFEIVEVEVRNKNYQGVIIKEAQKPSFTTKEIKKTDLRFSRLQIELANFIAQYYVCSLRESFSYFTPSVTDVDISTDVTKGSKNSFCELSSPLKSLSNEQEAALNFARDKKLSLIFGDTGSGKTEIYFHLILDVLKRGKNVLFLMPEISLTPQISRRLKDVFGENNVELWHSQIPRQERKKVSQRLDLNEVRILAGARSALFANLQNIGLIIVDEEHDSSYKSNGILGKKTFFNVRDLCIFLSQKFNIKVVLGSGTPSTTSYFLAKSRGYLYRLKGRFHATKREALFSNPSNFLSQSSLDLLEKTLKDKKQSIIFVPTRANFRSLVCSNCYEPVKCQNCSTPLSVHHKKNALICHYCGFKQDIPKLCPSCFNTEFFGKKSGTAQIAKDLKEYFIDAKIEVLDTDHARSKLEVERILEDFENSNIDILIGTQMISKGHDYDVELVIFLGLDSELKRRAFSSSSSERTFAMLHQVAGRSARKNDGTIMIESGNEDSVSKFIDDYENFLAYDIDNKRDSYPPFCKLIMLYFIDKDKEAAIANMQKALEFMNSHIRSGYFEIIGYAPNPIEKINKNFYYHIFLRTKRHAKTLALIHELSKKMPQMLVDVDPLDFVM
ncbi:MAG: primosomal protein N' [Helicobacter sp.]|nr:primosomal protein N' [Helicobacter sp.]